VNEKAAKPIVFENLQTLILEVLKVFYLLLRVDNCNNVAVLQKTNIILILSWIDCTERTLWRIPLTFAFPQHKMNFAQSGSLRRWFACRPDQFSRSLCKTCLEVFPAANNTTACR